MFNFKRFIKLTFTMVMVATIIIAGIVAITFFKLNPAYSEFPDDLQEPPANKDINVLLLGTDADEIRTDFIMLACYKPDKKKVALLSIPRDTKVRTNRPDGKINSAYRKGNEKIVFNEVKQITGVLPQYYVAIDLKVFRTVIDLMGGVWFDVPINMDWDDPLQNLHIHLTKGPQLLDGNKAEQLIRFRMNNDGTGYLMGDLERIKVQQDFLKEAIKQFVTPSNLLKINQVIKTVFENLDTNITLGDVAKHLKDALSLKKENIEFLMLPGEPEYIGDVSYFIYDEQEAMEVIKNSFVDTTEQEVLADDYKDGIDSTANIHDSNADSTDNIESQSKGNIEVLNSTDIRGLAARVATKLTDEGYTVKKVGNYYSRYHIMTKIIKRTDAVETQPLQKLLECGIVSNEKDDSSEVDITIILGADYKE